MADERTRGRRVWIGLGAVAGVVVVFLVGAWIAILVFHAQESRPLPEFGSLTRHPDPTLQGTVAYYAAETGCIRLVAASGQPSRELWCLPDEGPSDWVEVGKPVGPQLVWLPDGRLEVTMFRMTPQKSARSAPPLGPGWQKIVDVRTGAVEDVPRAEVPTAPDESTQPLTSPDGERLRWTFDPATGKAAVTLTSGDRTRTLLAVHGPGEYTYQFGPVFWAPGGQWVAATDDSRILVITPSTPPRTRVLVTGAGGGAGGGTAGPTFAVTTEDLLGA